MNTPAETSQPDVHPLNGLLMLLELQRQARRAASVPELRYHIVNQTRRLISYRQAAFLTLPPGNSRPVLEAVSNVAVLESNTPFVRWLEDAADAVVAQRPTQAGDKNDITAVRAVDPATLPSNIRNAWGEWSSAHVLWCPLAGSDGIQSAGVWLGRDEPWHEGELVLLNQLTEGYGHAWWALSGSRTHKRTTRRKVLLLMALLAIAGVLCWPVPMSTLAPAEIRSSAPVIVAAPLDGVIERFHVQPNEQVIAGQALFGFDSTMLRSRYEVARKGLTQAEAELLSASQAAFADPQTKARVAQLRTQVELRRAEMTLSRDLLDRVTVKAERAGIAVFADANEWLGKPVQIGERVLTLADPSAPEIDIQVAVGDALVLAEGSPVELFLNVDPLRPLRARLTHASYEAAPSAAGVLSYRVKAALEPAQDAGQPLPRIGLRGTAKIKGERVSLAFYLFRRPLAMLRQTLGV